MNKQYGGAAIEYIIVSTFALILSLGAVAWLGKAIGEKIKQMGGKLGIEPPALELDLGSN